MKPIKILHSGDFHYSRENQEKALLSLKTFYEKGREEKIDLFVIAGDLFDRALNNTESSGFPDLIHIIQQMMNVAPVVTVYGTKTHDLPGCYESFKEIDAEHNFTILQPGEAYFLDGFNGVVHKNYIDDQARLLILGIPEPSKEQFLKDKQIGKEEGNEAIKEGMRALLLGLAAVKKNYPHIPSLLVYHGAISGSSLCNSQVLPAGGIQIGEDDLALVGADYYALGHIHLAQQIGNLPAYYAGSAFPVDWGEIDKKGFNLVEFDGIERNTKPLMTPAILHPVYIDRIPYPHAPRLKIITALTGPWLLDGMNVDGFDVWLQVKVDKEKRSSVDIVKIGDKLREMGALMGTRVELVVRPTETIRSAEIQEAASLREKVIVYAVLSGEKVEKSTFEKADLLEAAAKEEGLTAEGLHIRIKKLSLRGAIGIRKGINQDKVEIDLDQYDPGLIALKGVNGCLAGDTLIDIPRDLTKHPYGIPIRELVGQEPLVYSYDLDLKKIILARATNIRKTGIQREVFRLKFTAKRHKGRFLSPLELVGTADHPVMLRDGTYKSLGELKPGDSLMPLYRRCRDGKYVWINLNNGEMALEHRMVAETIVGRALHKDEHGHHRDKNTFNNNENNIEGLHCHRHFILHGRDRPPHYDEHPRGMLGKHHRKIILNQISNSMKLRWSNPEERERRLKSQREFWDKNKKEWHNKKLLQRLYLEKKLSTTQIGNRFGVSDTAIRAKLIKYEIGRRTPYEGRIACGMYENHEVIDIEPAGYEDVYDIEVPRTSNFVANGVVVHNSGKTTLIENLHPYPQMLTRQGKLQDHFCLRDSFRDLYFIDERTGIEYRAFMQIDGQNKSGSVEYYLYRSDGDDWTPLTNGRKESYEEEINKLLGSLKLFLRSAFVSQKQPKNLPDLSEATKGEKKALFRELGGLDYLQVYADSAKEKEKALDRELISDRSKIESLEEQVKALPEKKGELLLLEASKETIEKKLEELRKKGFSLKDQEKELLEKVNKNKELRTTIDNASKELESYNEELETLNLKIDAYRSSLEGKADFEVQLDKFEDLKKQEAKLNEEKTKVLEEREKLNYGYNNEKEAVANAERSMLDQKAGIEKGSSEAHRERDVLEVEAVNLRDELSLSYKNCPTCGQKWPDEKLQEFEQKRAEKEQKLKENEQNQSVFTQDIINLRKEAEKLDTNIANLKWPRELKLPEFDNDVQLSDIRRQINLFPADQIKQNLEVAKSAEIRIEETKSRIEIVEIQIEEITTRKAELMNFIDKEVEAAYEAIARELEDTRERYAETDKELVRITTEITNIETQIKSIQNQLEVLQKIIQSREEKEKDLQEWQYLQRACGPDGIQALELDAMGPGIADAANSILESAYGSRFQIEFRTTRIGGSGSKTKQIEDFLIVIHDSIDGSEQLLETLSGGESVWIKRSIYDAFGIIRARKTGTKFLTCIMDECDGALDPESRMHYFKMLQKAHEESGRHHTIIISHSQECQEMIDQKIEMSELGEAVREEIAV